MPRSSPTRRSCLASARCFKSVSNPTWKPIKRLSSSSERIQLSAIASSWTPPHSPWRKSWMCERYVVRSRNRAIRKPSRAELAAAYGNRVPDVIATGLKILFVGINPGLYSGAVGHHFARPGNRFWRALHASGITPRLLSPYEERDLLQFGIGITNIVNRASAQAKELSQADLRSGARRLES